MFNLCIIKVTKIVESDFAAIWRRNFELKPTLISSDRNHALTKNLEKKISIIIYYFLSVLRKKTFRELLIRVGHEIGVVLLPAWKKFYCDDSIKVS